MRSAHGGLTQIVHVEIMQDRSGRSKGNGIVRFAQKADADAGE
jgi:hypothetical protein